MEGGACTKYASNKLQAFVIHAVPGAEGHLKHRGPTMNEAHSRPAIRRSDPLESSTAIKVPTRSKLYARVLLYLHYSCLPVRC